MSAILKCCLISSILVIGAYSASCPVPFQQQSRVFSDSVQMISEADEEKTNSQFQYQYVFEEAYTTNPQLAYGLNEFASQQSPLLQIKIESTQIGKDGIHFEVKSAKTSQWKALKINFLSTTRDDMELGSVEYVNEGSGTEEVFDVAYPLNKNFSSLGLKVKPFIQGFDLESQNKQSIGIKIQDMDIEGAIVYFSFANPQRVSLVRSLKLSLIVFNIHTPGVLYADGIIDQNFVTSKSEVFIPRHGINQLRTYIVGINSFHASAAQPISIAAAIDETFTLVIGPINRKQVDFISVSYLILSVVDCGSCFGFPLLFEGLCKLQCPAGTRERNGECIPIDCVNGYQLGPDGVCIPTCPSNQQFKNGRCTCIDKYYFIGGVCTQCPEGTFFNFKNVACQSLCGANAQFEGGVCYCNPGYFVIGNRCQTCPMGTRYDSTVKNCLSICSQKEVFDGQKCVCQSNYYPIDGVCGICPPATHYNPVFGLCQCPIGQQWHKTFQKCLPKCTQFQQLHNQKCICKPSTYKIDGVCGVCPPFSTYIARAETCQCYYSFSKVNGKCVCKQDEYFDAESHGCVRRCANSEDWVNGKCECVAGYHRDASGVCYPPCGVFEERVKGKCRCVAGYYKGVLGPCVPITCPPGHQWNPQRRQCRSVCPPGEIQIHGVCQCVSGYTRQLSHGVCLPSCPSNQVFVNGKCQCSPGNKIINGVCTNCPRYSQYVGGVCLCYNGNPPVDGQCQKLSCPDPNHVYDSITKTCKCKGPLVWMRGRCEYLKGCGANQYWCGTECVCEYGYVRENGVCVLATAVTPQCPVNARFNGVNCVCNAGFFPIDRNVCGVCGGGAYWDGVKCNNDGSRRCNQGYVWTGVSCRKESYGCGDGAHWDGSGCRCNTGYHYISGACTKCEYGTYFDGTGCTSNYVQSCLDPYKFWNGLACVCVPGYFPYGSSCVRCPPGTSWNGVCCMYPTGIIAPLNVANGY